MRRRRKDEPVESSSGKEPPFVGPIVIPIEDCLDLHPFAPADIPNVVEEYIENVRKLNFTKSD